MEKERYDTFYCIVDNHDQHRANELTFMPILGYGCYSFFFFLCQLVVFFPRKWNPDKEMKNSL